MAYLLDFEKLVKDQLARVERMKNEPPATDFSTKEKIVIGFIDGDGIGPVIMKETRRVLDHLLADEIESGKVEMKTIEGLTLENRIEKTEGFRRKLRFLSVFPYESFLCAGAT